MEICNTRTKKSCSDMFNFSEDMAGHDMVTDAGRATTCKRKFKAPSLQTKCAKNEEKFENMGFNGKQFEDFRRKKNSSSLIQLTPVKHIAPKCKN